MSATRKNQTFGVTPLASLFAASLVFSVFPFGCGGSEQAYITAQSYASGSSSWDMEDKFYDDLSYSAWNHHCTAYPQDPICDNLESRYNWTADQLPGVLGMPVRLLLLCLQRGVDVQLVQVQAL